MVNEYQNWFKNSFLNNNNNEGEHILYIASWQLAWVSHKTMKEQLHATANSRGSYVRGVGIEAKKLC